MALKSAGKLGHRLGLALKEIIARFFGRIRTIFEWFNLIAPKVPATAPLDTATHLVITLHGIRTFGGWQEGLERTIKSNVSGATIEFVNYKYGYFSVIAFIIPFLRWLVVRQFRLELRRLMIKRYDRVDIVGHSFGTHVLAWGLRGLKPADPIKIHTVILSGSVLRSTFPWRELLGTRVMRVVNDCGSRDNVLLLSQFWVLFTGMAGRVGLTGATGEALRNRFSQFGHSGYFVDQAGLPSVGYMEDHWLPLILSSDPVEHFDHRGAISPLEGVLIMLGNNAEPVKMLIYGLPFVLLTLWINQQRNDAVASALLTTLRNEERANSAPAATLLPLATASARLSESLQAKLLIERETRLLPRRIAAARLPFGGDHVDLIAPNRGNSSAIVVSANGGTQLVEWKSKALRFSSASGSGKIAGRSPDGRFVVQSQSKTLRVLGAFTREVVGTITLSFVPSFATVASNGKYVAAADDDKIWVYELSSGAPLTITPFDLANGCGNEGHLHRLAIGSDGDFAVAVRSLRQGALLCEIDLRNGTIRVVAGSSSIRSVSIADGKRRYSAVTDSGVLLVSENQSHAYAPRRVGHWAATVQYNHDGRFLAYIQDRTVRVWDTLTRQRVADATTTIDSIYDVMFADDGRTLIVGGDSENKDGFNLEIWDLMAAEAYSDARLAPGGGSALVAINDTDDALIYHRPSGQLTLVARDGAVRWQEALGDSGWRVVLDVARSQIVAHGAGRTVVWSWPKLMREQPTVPAAGWRFSLTRENQPTPIYLRPTESQGSFDILSTLHVPLGMNVRAEHGAENAAFIVGGRYIASLLRANLGRADERITLRIRNTSTRRHFDVALASIFWNAEVIGSSEHLLVSDQHSLRIVDLKDGREIRKFELELLSNAIPDPRGQHAFGCRNGQIAAIDLTSGQIISEVELGDNCRTLLTVLPHKDLVWVHTDVLQSFRMIGGDAVGRACARLSEKPLSSQFIAVGESSVRPCQVPISKWISEALRSLSPN